MSEAVPRWAWIASLALHVGVIALGLLVPRLHVSRTFLSDFWAGKTFEVPDTPSEVGEGEAPSEPDESSNEINVDGLDLSPNTQARLPPPSPAEGATAPAPPPRARVAARSTASSTAPAASHGSGPGGTFGAEGATPGVRDLLGAFVRTVPLVASADQATWASLPLGAAGSADVTLVLDDEGKPRLASSSPAPVHLRRLVTKTVSVMSGGRFGISSTEGIATEQKLRIAVTISQEGVPSQDQAVSGGLFALRFDPPDSHGVRHAAFTLGSGRHVDIAVRGTTH
jgi:hypothetical protein